MAHHALFRDYNVDDPSARQAARDRLGAVNEVLASMVDATKSERSAVRLRNSWVCALSARRKGQHGDTHTARTKRAPCAYKNLQILFTNTGLAHTNNLPRIQANNLCTTLLKRPQ